MDIKRLIHGSAHGSALIGLGLVVLGALSAWLGLERIPAWRRFISRRRRGYRSLAVRILSVLIALPPSIAMGAFIVTVVLHRSIYGS